MRYASCKLVILLLLISFMSGCQIMQPQKSTTKGLPIPRYLIYHCHQNFSFVLDSLCKDTVLEVRGFPLQEYPGLEINWLPKTVWKHNQIKIAVRQMNPQQLEFELFIYDGKGSMDYVNRYQQSLASTGGWDTLVVDLSKPLTTVNGRLMHLGKRTRSCLYINNKHADTIDFRLGAILMQ